MPRIAGVDLPRNKRVEIGLTYIYGIGRSRSNEILDEHRLHPAVRRRGGGVRGVVATGVGGRRDCSGAGYTARCGTCREVAGTALALGHAEPAGSE